MINLADFWQKLLSDLQNNNYWKNKILDTNSKIHLALMVEPYLSLILRGEKTIESRFSSKRIIPFNNISKGDIVILKKSGGGIVAVFEVEYAHFKKIECRKDFEEIKEKYGKELCLEEQFWERKKDANYVSLIKISHLQEIPPIFIKKANRQSWLTYIRQDNNTIINTNNSKIACVVGKIASGKTTVASELASVLHGEQFSVSDYLKYCLKKSSIGEPSRTQLQDLGEKFIANGWDDFCSGFLQFIEYDMSKTYVIDGIRHKGFFDALCRKVYPVNPVLIYLNVSNQILEKRKIDRQELGYDDKRLAEGNLAELYDSADFIINAHKKNVQNIVSEIFQAIKTDTNKKIADDKITLQYLKETIDSFNRDRNWNSYHNALNLAMSINIEAAELLEIFQWSDKKEAENKARFSNTEHMREELADILIYCINLANAYGIDISSCIIEKLQKNAKKYPAKCED